MIGAHCHKPEVKQRGRGKVYAAIRAWLQERVGFKEWGGGGGGGHAVAARLPKLHKDKENNVAFLHANEWRFVILYLDTPNAQNMPED